MYDPDYPDNPDDTNGQTPPDPSQQAPQIIPLNGARVPQALLDLYAPGWTIDGDNLVRQSGTAVIQQPELDWFKSLSNASNAKDWKTLFANLISSKNQNGFAANPLMDDAGSASVKKRLSAYGINVTPANTTGQVSKVQMPDGSWVRVVTGDTTGTGWKWDWVPGAQAGGEGPPGPAGGSTPIADTVAPFDYPDFAPPPFETPDFNAPDAFQYPDYQLPSGEEVLKQDPGYDLRNKEGQRAIVNNALSKGLGRSTGTLKSLADFAGSLASQEYSGAADRGFNTWKANRSAAVDNYDRAWRDDLTTYGLKYGQQSDTYQRAADVYKTNLAKYASSKGYSLDLANLKLGETGSYWDKLLSLYGIATRGLPSAPPA